MGSTKTENSQMGGNIAQIHSVQRFAEDLAFAKQTIHSITTFQTKVFEDRNQF